MPTQSGHVSAAPALPQALNSLIELALDLRWTWCHTADALWRRIDADRWASTHNPWLILQTASERQLAALTKDAAFMTELERVSVSRQQYLSAPTWFETVKADAGDMLIAYFSMEYGLGEALPLYAGGLGILAGDHLKTASDLGVPLVGVGLLYQQGYFRQMLDASGWQHELYPVNAPASLPIQAAYDTQGAPLRVPIELPGRRLFVQVWRAQVGRVALYLLDSNDPSNSPADRGITSQLYGGDIETRLAQEIVLGIGGWRALRALGVDATVCHLNEGHAAFAALERARQFAQHHDVSFKMAQWVTRAGSVFTTHTPVASAFDTYPDELIAQYGIAYAKAAGIDPVELLSLRHQGSNGNNGSQSEPFNMAFFAARLCQSTNAVSRLHGSVSRRIFAPLFPRWPQDEVPISHITNGVHVPSWDSPWADTLWTGACGKGRWLGSVEQLSNEINALTDATLWHLRAQERQDLVGYARERLTQQIARRGATVQAIENASTVLDPNVLTLGFARRFTAYKRPDLLLHDPSRLAQLLNNPTQPAQIIVAGKAHPHDELGKRLVHDWATFANGGGLRHRVVFLEDYDIALAQQLLQGVDVWINTPRRPWEACGTSGMKVLVNGGLNLSVLDGWWAEAYEPDVGWAINPTANEDERTRDEDDAAALYRLLEQQIVPAFYQRGADGIPAAWVKRMRTSMAALTPRFSSNRMMAQYVLQAYAPAAAAYAARSRNGGALAHALVQYETQLRHHWHELHLSNFNAQCGAEELIFSVHAHLGGITADQIQVQLYADASDDHDRVVAPMHQGELIAGVTNGFAYSLALRSERSITDFTPRVIPRHESIRIPTELRLIYWLPR
jgi:glycogen phosphorylase